MSNYYQQLTISDRLQQAFRYLKQQCLVKNQIDLADKMGVSSITVSRSLTGALKGEKFAKDLNAVFNFPFSIEWLLYGTGDMLAYHEQQHDRTQHPAIIPDSPVESQPLSPTLPPEHVQKTEDEPIPAWADSLINLVSNNTAVIESLRKDNATLLQEIAELREVVVSLRSSLLSIHHPVIYDEKTSALPMAAEKI